jgi:hypothetical protein
MGISNKMVQLFILHTAQQERYKRCSMTESSVQDCGHQDHLILVLVIFACGAALGKYT